MTPPIERTLEVSQFQLPVVPGKVGFSDVSTEDSVIYPRARAITCHPVM